jgi:hypothetical protein
LKRYFVLSFTLLSLANICWASPDRLEVIFLSQSKTASIINFLDKKTKNIFLSSAIAQNGSKGYEEEYVIDFSDPEGFEDAPPLRNMECVPMGDGCFHPQLGYLDKIPGALKGRNGTGINKRKKKKEEVENDPFKQNTFNSDDISLVECQEGRYFDIFCGKERKPIEAAGLEVWIDTSSSLRNIDYSSEKNYCERRFFVSKLKNDCKAGVAFSVFDTARKSLGSYDTLCDYVGSNNGPRMVSWIEANSSKHLVIITDVDEYHGAFREYLEKTNAIIHGIGVRQITAKDLGKFIPKISKSCKTL